LDYDDVGVGVAAVLSRRPDYWRPEFSRRLFLGAAVAVAAAFAVLTAAAGPAPTQALWYGLAAVAMVLGAVVAGRLAHDPDLGVVAGLAGCGYAVLAGFAARRGAAGLFTLDRKALLITGCAAAGTAIIVAMAARLPGAVFGTVLGLGIAATAGATMALVFHLTAAAAAAALAVLLYASTTVNLRIALRGARLRVALLPHTSEELQQDIDPEAEAVVTARTSRVTAHLNALFITSALVAAVAAVQLTRERGWIGWALAAALSTAILLRARILTIAWQRAPLAMCGLTGLCLVVVSQVRQLGQPAVSVVLPALLACCAALLIAARRLPGRRLLPIWGQLADHLELWSSILLVPLLLQMFHVYARLRALIN
jgi:type VII secretion integral membrane protein EccD